MKKTHGGARVSIPFIAGQWSLPGGSKEDHHMEVIFNPLHCGAVVASLPRRRFLPRQLFSIPFIAGQWSLR